MMMRDARMTGSTYRTSDFYLASWLLTKGFVLEGVDRANPRRLEFIFTDRLDRAQIVQEFQCGRAEGNITDFLFQLRKAKRLLYDAE